MAAKFLCLRILIIFTRSQINFSRCGRSIVAIRDLGFFLTAERINKYAVGLFHYSLFSFFFKKLGYNSSAILTGLNIGSDIWSLNTLGVAN